MTVGEKLVQIDTKLDTVIAQHGSDIAENKVTAGSAHTRLDVLALQVNTHEVRISDLREKSVGAFGKIMMGISGAVGLGGLVTVWLK